MIEDKNWGSCPIPQLPSAEDIEKANDLALRETVRARAYDVTARIDAAGANNENAVRSANGGARSPNLTGWRNSQPLEPPMKVSLADQIIQHFTPSHDVAMQQLIQAIKDGRITIGWIEEKRPDAVAVLERNAEYRELKRRKQ